MTEAALVQIRLRYLVEDVDRHGNVRLYVRAPGAPKVRLREMPVSEGFMAAYHAALKGVLDRPKPTGDLTLRRLVVLYEASPAFKALAPATQAWRRRALRTVVERHGDKPVAMMEARHVEKERDRLASTPGASRTVLKALKALFAWAVPKHLLRDPAKGVPVLRYKTEGHRAWTEADVSTLR